MRPIALPASSVATTLPLHASFSFANAPAPDVAPLRQAPASSLASKPAKGGLIAWTSALPLRRAKRLVLLPLLMLAPLAAAPVFTAPAGCTAIQPAPNGEGVQCFGSNEITLEFSGTGAGPLWASTIVFEWDFSASREQGSTSPVLVATVNGESFFRIFDVIHQPEARRTGSASIPYTPGTTLTSWTVIVQELWGGYLGGGPILSAAPTVSTPLDGVGFRFLASNQPPEPSAVPKPATAGLLALAGAALLLRRAKRLVLLPLVALAPLAAAPIFTAPAGCTAIQPAPSGEGVACYGDTGLVRGGTPQLSFAGSGTGPLWASEVVFQWDFEVGGGGGNIVLVHALVNGEPGQANYGLTFDFTTPYSGSVSIPYVPGTVLSSWSILVTAIPNTLIGGDSRSIVTPSGGLGLRLLAANQPTSDVPEPGTFLVCAAASLWVLASTGRKR